jgi:hypothetical protein
MSTFKYSLDHNKFALGIYCPKQQTTCILNTVIRMDIIKKLMVQTPVTQPVILVTWEAEIWDMDD